MFTITNDSFHCSIRGVLTWKWTVTKGGIRSFCQILKSWRWWWRLNISRISPNHVFIAGFWEVEACQKQMRSSYYWRKCIPLEYYFLVSNFVFLGPYHEHSVLWEAMNTKQLFRNWLHCGDEGGDRYEEMLKGHLCPNQGKMHLFPLCRNR